MSIRGDEWLAFAQVVHGHIESYTVPQYGDKGKDLATAYTPEHCIAQIKKYAARAGSNQRDGQEALDLLKIAHYAQMAHRLLTVSEVG
ncbi:hypothetical protein [Methylomonas sp. CM2]|uniref:hypothetical protein n=1 Tax=Methylomonas sp. CM2 TaxID=3417647 RepID=UPI003CECB8C0